MERVYGAMVNWPKNMNNACTVTARPTNDFDPVIALINSAIVPLVDIMAIPPIKQEPSKAIAQ